MILRFVPDVIIVCGVNMIDQLDPFLPRERTDNATPGEALGVFVMLLAVACISLVGFVLLAEKSHGTQLALMIPYSGYVFVYTFFRTRGVSTKHSLAARYVQRQLPRLLVIHCAYLAILYLVAGWALANRLSFPAWWQANPPLGWIPSVMALGVSQVILCRIILGRAQRESASRGD